MLLVAGMLSTTCCADTVSAAACVQPVPKRRSGASRSAMRARVLLREMCMILSFSSKEVVQRLGHGRVCVDGGAE